MKRVVLIAVSSSALALGAPAVASAHHHGRHHSKRHAARARVLDFRASIPATSSSPGSSGSPATPATPSTESAGTIKSFKEGTNKEGVLVITLTDGTEVSGKVTDQTEILCAPTAPAPGGDDSDDEAGSGEGDHGSSTHGESTEGSHGDAHAASSGDDDEDGQDEGPQSCTTAALVPPAMVREAELKISSAGAVWERVALL
jgi:hypothetical protein